MRAGGGLVASQNGRNRAWIDQDGAVPREESSGASQAWRIGAEEVWRGRWWCGFWVVIEASVAWPAEQVRAAGMCLPIQHENPRPLNTSDAADSPTPSLTSDSIQRRASSAGDKWCCCLLSTHPPPPFTWMIARRINRVGFSLSGSIKPRPQISRLPPFAFLLPARALQHSIRCMSLQSPSPSPQPEERSPKRRRLEPPVVPSIYQGKRAMTTPATASRTLELTEVEQTLRRLLLDVAEYIDSSPLPASEESQVQLPDELANAKLVLRFTGGWVRDKLLGVESHDIDVAINKMTGYQFGLRLKEYLEIPGNPEKYGLEGVTKSEKAGTSAKNKQVGGLHKIEANPEKSKHLETVTTKILGLDIDLVNLRKETYTEDSRNPQMEFGTPEEDALRRDATVNAMFYNLNTSEVEDFTGQGFDDMQKRIIRTPLEPYQTFKDDPLRVLRLIRFASRLGYSIDPLAEEFMGNEDIKRALHIKISRERVGVELEKALRGKNSRSLLSYLLTHLQDPIPWVQCSTSTASAFTQRYSQTPPKTITTHPQPIGSSHIKLLPGFCSHRSLPLQLSTP